MPYIEQSRRHELHDTINRLDWRLHQMGDVGGDLNYVIFMLMYYQAQRAMKYATLERLRGCLESCASEFYQRVVGPYEDQAKDKNGDII